MAVTETKEYSLDPFFLGFHNRTQIYQDFSHFQADLPSLLQEAKKLPELVRLTKVLGILEPITSQYHEPESIQIYGNNYRESIQVNGLISRNRAVLLLLEELFGSLANLRDLDLYLPEYFTGLAIWMSHHVGLSKITFSEYLADTTLNPGSHSVLLRNEDLSALTFDSNTFDVVICNELFEHLRHLRQALKEIFRVLRPGGSLVATFPMAFGEYEHIQKTSYSPDSDQDIHFAQPEYHGDPVRPDQGSLVYTIPGWQILSDLSDSGFASPQIRHMISWQYGIYGSDLPGVLVLHATKPKH